MAKKQSTQCRYDDSKIDEYVRLMLDQDKLANASKSIIRKKRSPLARRIEQKNIPAIKKVAMDVLHGSLKLNQKRELCKKIYEAKKNLRKAIKSEHWREIVSTLIFHVVSTINCGAALVIALLWIIRDRLYVLLCRKKDMSLI